MVYFFLIIIIGICYLLYDSIPSNYAKLEESFGGFMNKNLVGFEYEKSPLHTIVYGGTGTGKTYFIRQYLKLYSVHDQDENQNQDLRSSLVNPEQNSFTDQAKNRVIVCKDYREWIDPESNKFYTVFNNCDINMITKKKWINFKIV